MTDENKSSGVCSGVRVLEWATGIAGPYAAMFLGDNGADVVKVEPPSGDPYRSEPGFQTINRNKSSVVVDGLDQGLDGPGADRLEALLRAADVIIVDRPGRAATVRAVNPTAVVIAMPPWGERGELVDHACTTALLHAATGIAWNQQSYAEVPVDIVVPIAEYGAGALGALAATAGLVAARRRNAAPSYEVSLAAGAAAVQLGEFRPAGEPQVRPGDAPLGSKGRVACYRLVEAGDGRWFFLACGTRRFYERMLDVIGRPELIDDPLLANPPWGLLLDEAIGRLSPILDEVFATRSRHEWLDALRAADVPAQPVLTRDEFLATSIVEANEMTTVVAHPELGDVSMMGLPFTIDGAPGAIDRAAPTLGAQTETTPRRWDFHTQTDDADPDPDPDADVPDATRPLAGLTVIDLASFIAGPVVSRHLGMLGAEVIKVEQPGGDPFRTIGPPFLSWNQGKRSVVLDLTDAADRAVLHRMVGDADIVVENFRPGVAARLGVDRDTLRAVNPALIFLSSPGYGLDESMAARPAFDPLMQALGGLMAAQGGIGHGGPEPVFLSVPIHDVMTPLVGAIGLTMAVLARDRTGAGQHVRTSLAHSTMVAQAAEYTRFEGRPSPPVGGFDHPGPDDAHSWEETTDGRFTWHDGPHTVEVCRHGLTGSTLAEDNDLLSEDHHPAHGPLVVFGQLIGGAGPPPTPAPTLDDAGDQLRRSYSQPSSRTTSQTTSKPSKGPATE